MSGFDGMTYAMKTFQKRMKETSFKRRLLNNPAKVSHNFVAFHLLHLKPEDSAISRMIKKSKGQSIRAGVASGKLLSAIGAKEKFPAGTKGSRSTTLNRKYLKWTPSGFQHGVNLPDYTDNLEKGWGPLKYTPKQAAFMTYEIIKAAGNISKNKTNRKERDIKRGGRDSSRSSSIESKKAERKQRVKRKKPSRDISKKQAKGLVENSKNGFHYGLFLSLLKNTHRNQPRPFQHLSDSEATIVAQSLSASLGVEINDILNEGLKKYKNLY